MRGIGPCATRERQEGSGASCVAVCQAPVWPCQAGSARQCVALSGKFSQATPNVCTATTQLVERLAAKAARRRCGGVWEAFCAGLAGEAAVQEVHEQEAEACLAVMHDCGNTQLSCWWAQLNSYCSTPGGSKCRPSQAEPDLTADLFERRT